MKKFNQEETRQNNSRLVLSTIYNNDEISRVSISRSTGLTRTTVSAIVAEFIAEGLVIESGFSPSTGGKPATLLRVDENAHLLVGVDLAEDTFHGSLVNLRGEMHQRLQIPVGECDGVDALELVYSLIEQLFKTTKQPIRGIGIGAPGLMDPTRGVVRQAINLKWKDLPLGQLLSQKYHLPVYVANDCQVAALGEYSFGNTRSSENMILIKTGRGIGAGIVLGGKLFYGDNAGAGEIGHIQVIENGELCRCGNRGCLETILSNQKLIDQARAIAFDHPESILNHLVSHPNEISIKTLVEAYQNADSWVVSLIDEVVTFLGAVIANLAGALNINRILISGSLRYFGDGLLIPIHQRVQGGILPGLACQTEVGFSTLAEDIVIKGAASMVLKNELGLV
jgi:N-acetylglucosamine repressor